MSNLLPCPICGDKLKIHGPEDWKPTRYDPDSGGDPYSASCDCGFHYSNGSYDYSEFIICLNRRAQPENEPLTLDEMNALDHEPIYVLHTGGKWTMNGWHIATASSYQNHGRCDLEIDNGNTTIDTQNYGITWLAYRRKPERSEGE